MMEALITNLINNIFHSVWLYHLALEPRHDRRGQIICSVLFTVFEEMSTLALIILHIPSNLIHVVGFMLFAVILTLMFSCTLSASHPAKSSFLLCSYFCLWAFIYCFISLVTNSSAGAGDMTIWGLRIGLNFFFLFVYRFFFRDRLKRIYREVQGGYGMLTVISVMTFVLMSAITIYHNHLTKIGAQNAPVVIISYLFALMIYILLFYFLKQTTRMYQLRQLKLHEELLTAQLSGYEQIEQDAKQTRHDFRHHNTVIANLAKQKDYAGILSYLEEYERIEEEKAIPQYSTDPALNSLFLAYQKKAEQKGIDFKICVHLREISGISSVDLVSVLANMLENAFKGCLTAEEHRTEIRAQKKGSILLLDCRNTYDGQVLFRDGLPRAKDHEGIGAESIRSTAAKYDGSADFFDKDGMFICRVLLNARADETKKT